MAQVQQRVAARESVWALVRRADALRALGDPGRALRVLDRAWALGPAEDAELAIYTCAIAAHCDLRQHFTAVLIEREQVRRAIDAGFARAAHRLYAELEETVWGELVDGRRQMYAALLELEAGAAA